MDKIALIKKQAEDLLNHLAIVATVAVEEEKDGFGVKIQTEESGVLIGYHGETLAGLQLILNQAIQRQLNEWVRITVDVGDYRLRREEALNQLAQSTAQQVVDSGQAHALPPMSASERRIVHLALAEHPSVKTFSEGEGGWRRVIVQPKVAGA